MVGHNSHKTGQLHTAITGLYYHLVLLQYYNITISQYYNITILQFQRMLNQAQSFSVSPTEPKLINQNISRNCSQPVDSHGQLIVSNWWRKLSDYKKLTITIRLTCQ